MKKIEKNMVAVFVHDHYFVKDKNTNIYYDGSGGSFTSYMWKRYLSVFDKLIVIGREKNSLPNKLVISSSENVEFYLNSDIKSAKDKILKSRVISKKLRKKISEVDLVFARLPSTLGYLAIDECIAMQKPFVVEVVGCPFDAYWNYGSLFAKLIAPFQFLKLRKYIRLSQHTIYVTQLFLQKRYPSLNHQVGISNVNILKVVSLEEALDFYNDDLKLFQICLIGSFHVKYKGHVEALKALKYIVDCGFKKLRLNLVGTGDYTWVLELVKKMNLSEYVNIVGLLEAGEKGVLPFLDTQHLYIHPSKQEGLPRVVLEAMSRGKLVLGASVAGIPELLDDEFLHRPGAWEVLGKQILSIYNTKDRWEAIIKNNLLTASKYTEDELQHRRYEFINEVIK